MKPDPWPQSSLASINSIKGLACSNQSEPITSQEEVDCIARSMGIDIKQSNMAQMPRATIIDMDAEVVLQRYLDNGYTIVSKQK
jgi:hypothetical protein